MDNKAINPQAIVALREALTCIYWYKSDLRSFLTAVLGDSPLLLRVNWDDYKRNIVQQIVDSMIGYQNRYHQELVNLMVATASMDDFSHLQQLDDGKQKAANARRAVEALRHYTQGHEFISTERKLAEERRQAHALRIKRASALQLELTDLYREYSYLVLSSDKQARGYALEKMLKQVFDLFDLDPKASFRIEGEQIDGSFVFESTDFLFEAKWHDQWVSADALDSFAAKVRRKFDAKGLFLSISGFSPEGVKAHSSGDKVLLLMDGADLTAVLEGRIDLKELLSRKRRHAARTGEIYYPYRDMTA